MPVLETRAYAKLNLSLDVLDRRSDGYHEMRMVMQTVTLSDALRLETGTGKPLSMRSSLGFLPADERNLAAAAALRLCAATGADCGGLSIELDKSIPVCAGLAGGSADAAAVLRGLNRLLGLGLPPERLEAIGARVGSDVPYCVRGGTALAEGRGEVLTTLPALPDCHVVLCKPAFSVPTPELFARLDGCRIRRRPDTAGLLAALAAVSFFCVMQTAQNSFKGLDRGKYSFTLLMPAYTCCVWLIAAYQVRAGDPVQLDYVYELFAIIASLLGLYFHAGFSFERGRVFWAGLFSLLGIYFCLTTLADQHDLATTLLYGFAILYLLSSTVTLLYNAGRPELLARAENDTTEGTPDES